MKFAPMAITAMALLQQHDARWDILIEPAARRRAAIEARGHSEWGRSELGAQSGRKNQPVCNRYVSNENRIYILMFCVSNRVYD